jgi:predicted dehydrogenase
MRTPPGMLYPPPNLRDKKNIITKRGIFPMKKVKIGIVGSKFAANFHADSIMRSGKAEISAVASLPEDAAPFAKKWNIPKVFTDYNEMFKEKDIDLVSVCVPNFLHCPVVLSAAKHGKHIICEKPLATSYSEGRQMIEAAEKHGVKLMYAEDWCYAPALMRAVKIIKEGGIGDILYIKGKEVHSGTHSPFAKNKQTCGGGSLIHLAIHPIGWALHLVSDEGRNRVVEITGKTNGGGDNNYVHKDNTGEDWAVGIMKFENGVHAFVEGNYITTGGMDDRVEIYGTKGVIKADLSLGSCLNVYSSDGYSYAVEKAVTTKGWTKPAVDEFYNLGYEKELAYFIDCVINDKKPVWAVSGEGGLKCLEIIEAMYASDRDKKTIILR